MHLPIHRGSSALFLDPNISRCLQRLSNVNVVSAPPQIWVRVPFVEKPLQSLSASQENYINGWLIWNEIRNQTGNNPRLFVAIDLSALKIAPASKGEESSLLRSLRKWGAEPIKAVLLSTSCFHIRTMVVEGTEEEKSLLSLPNIFKEILSFFFKFNIHVIISGAPAENIGFHR